MERKSNDSKSDKYGTLPRNNKNDTDDGEEDNLPNSLRNAPPELRLAIRRRQNNESARRSRAKKKEEERLIENKVQKCEDRLRKLETEVEELTSELTKPHGSSSTSTDRARSSGKEHSKLSRRASHHTRKHKNTQSK